MTSTLLLTIAMASSFGAPVPVGQPQLFLPRSKHVGKHGLSPGDVAQPDAKDTAEGKEDLFFPAKVEVDVSALKKEQDPVVADETASWITDELEKHMRDDYRLQVVKGDDGDAAKVVMRLSWVHYMDSRYMIAIQVQRPDGTHADEITYPCDDCFDGDLVDAAIAHLPEIMAQLRKPSAAATAEPEPSVPSEETTAPVAEQADETQPATTRPRRGVMIAGYSAIGLGAGALIGGVVALTRPIEPHATAPAGVTNYHPLGIGLAVGGGVVLATGAVLVAVEATRCKRRGTCDDGRSASTAVLPLLDTTTAGFGILHRF